MNNIQWTFAIMLTVMQFSMHAITLQEYLTENRVRYSTDSSGRVVLDLSNRGLTDVTGLKELITSLGSHGPSFVLNLSYNQISDLPDDFWSGVGVADLVDLSHNQLRQIPNYVATHPKLPYYFTGSIREIRNLDLSHNQLDSLPEGIGSSIRIDGSLNLSNNNLQELPATFTSLHQLKYLDLSNNQLTQLPALPFSLLKTFNAANNRLTRFPNINGFNSLVDLNLANNQITTLPDNIGRLNRHIENLNLANNNITELPESFMQLTKKGEYKHANITLTGNPVVEKVRALLEKEQTREPGDLENWDDFAIALNRLYRIHCLQL